MKVNKKEAEKIVEIFERKEEFREYFAENYEGVKNMYMYFRRTRLSTIVKAILHEVHWLVDDYIAFEMMKSDMNKGENESYGARILCKNNNEKADKLLVDIVEGKCKSTVSKKLIALDGLKYHEKDHSDAVIKLLHKTTNFTLRNACFDYLFFKKDN